jgi:hypothetical protein
MMADCTMMLLGALKSSVPEAATYRGTSGGYSILLLCALSKLSARVKMQTSVTSED